MGGGIGEKAGLRPPAFSGAPQARGTPKILAPDFCSFLASAADLTRFYHIPPDKKRRNPAKANFLSANRPGCGQIRRIGRPVHNWGIQGAK